MVTVGLSSASKQAGSKAAASNPDEIELDDEEEVEMEEAEGEEEGKGAPAQDIEVEEKIVPDTVFGKAIELVEQEKEKGTMQMGAKERFKRKAGAN